MAEETLVNGWNVTSTTGRGGPQERFAQDAYFRTHEFERTATVVFRT